MQNKKYYVLLALIIPIAALLASVAYREYIKLSGATVTLPIHAYDPRDILSGHYLTYRIDYGITNICNTEASAQIAYSQDKDAYICLEPKQFSFNIPNSCKILIKGRCSGNDFIAGIERYYIAQKDAPFLTQQLVNNKASVVLAITPDGVAQVVGLKISDKSI